MAYQQLKIQSFAQYAEQINTFLLLFDALAITYEDAANQPILEPALNTTPLWNKIYIVSLFTVKTDIEKIIDFIRNQLGEAAIVDYFIEQLTEKNWERAWLEHFHPMKFGNNLWICPSVIEPPDPQATNIILDPGLAFGTGSHPTTFLCLDWLAQHAPGDKVVIDYGCGSGILAIAALKLGAKQVWAIDHDEQALEATRENAIRNRIDLSSLKIGSPEQLAAVKVDLLIANILAKPLIELAPAFHNLLKPGGEIVLSGILENQANEVIEAYSAFVSNIQIQQKEEWVLIEATLNSNP